MRYFFFIVLPVFMYLAKPACAQVYDLDPREDGILIGLGAGLNLGGIAMWQGTSGLQPSYYQTLYPEMIGRFDRVSVYNWSPETAKKSDYLLFGTCAVPVAFALLSRSKSELWNVGVIGVETILLVTGALNMTKNSVLRTRPFVYNDLAPDEKKKERDARYSFFSGHTAVSASAAFFVARLYHDFYPESRLRALVWAGAAVLPAAVGYMRIRAGKHFPTDVMTGYLVGASASILIPWLHKSGRDRWAFGPAMGLNGMAFSYKF